MIELDFRGWYQCRLATDPDPFDDSRGVEGWTFAMPGERDLDRVIRFHDRVAPRSRCPTVCVFVLGIRINGVNQPGHNAKVSLLAGAVYEGRNGQVAVSAAEPIVPFHLDLRRGAFALVGRDPIDLNSSAEISRRQPIDLEPASSEVRAETGVTDFAQHRAQRRHLLQDDVTNESDPTRRAALMKRIDELAKGSIRPNSLGFKLSYESQLRGPIDWLDPTRVAPPLPAGASWSVKYWMGGWDADALCGFVKGSLTVTP